MAPTARADCDAVTHRTRSAGVAVFLACAGAGFPAAHGQSAAPPARAHHALVYDASRQVVLLSGGSTPRDGGRRFVFFGDLWAYDGTAWRLLPQADAPMSGFGLVFDPSRARVLSFGGFTPDNRTSGALRALADTSWQRLSELAARPLAEPGVVFDTRRGRLVTFGGSGSGGASGDTWEYHGSAWTRVAHEGPPPRQAHAMAFDERRGRAVVFGGMAAGAPGQRPTALGDTWEFDGRDWSRRDVPGPSARHGAGIAFDSRRGLIILFGGVSADGFQGDTWSWDGRQWSRLAADGPEPRAMGYLAYDARRDRIVLFGGRKGWPDGDLGDTWEWDGTAWRRVQ